MKDLDKYIAILEFYNNLSNQVLGIPKEKLGEPTKESVINWEDYSTALGRTYAEDLEYRKR